MKKLSLILTSFCAALTCCPNSHAAEVLQPFDFDSYDARMASMDEQDRIAQEQINQLCAPFDDNFDNLSRAVALSKIPQPQVPLNLFRHEGSGEEAMLQEVLEESRRTAQIEEERRVEQAQRDLKATHEEKSAAQNSAISASQLAEWEPLIIHIIRAGELVMELKRDKGGINPDQEEMVQCLTLKMGITANQATKILEELLD